MNVLGTDVRQGAAAARAVLISDLHVGADGGDVVAAMDAAVAHAEGHADAMFVLGDLFDSYVSRAQVRVGVWRDVAARFQRAVAGGLRLVVLVGNRDFLLGPEFSAASGVELVHGGYRAELGGVDTLLLHGDELCQNDLPYQRAKRWLRHPLTRGVARRLPLPVARWAAERARDKSRDVVRSGDQSRFLPSEQAVSEAVSAGAARLVFGHIHRHARGEFGAADYHVLPAFDEAHVGLWIEPGRLQAVRFGAAPSLAPVEPSGACPWSP
jgi:UDP-2,3-diacylglucosamine hydrolase